jgi:hypothetical protein
MEFLHAGRPKTSRLAKYIPKIEKPVNLPAPLNSNDLLKKIPLIGKDLSEYSQDTVKMFVEDDIQSNLKL